MEDDFWLEEHWQKEELEQWRPSGVQNERGISIKWPQCQSVRNCCGDPRNCIGPGAHPEAFDRINKLPDATL